MLIYILHNDRFYTFRLPKNVSGNYVMHDYDIYGLKRSLVNIYASNGQWILNSNDDIKISVNGKFIDNVILKERCFYSLKLYKTENVLLYVNPGYQNDYITKTILDNSSLIIGNDSNADILYSCQGIAKKQMELSYINGRWSFKNLCPSIPIYINKVRRDFGDLSNFDMIFIMGMKIVICNKIIFISCSPNLYHFVSQKFSNEVKELAAPLYENNSLVFKDFYDASEYFYKSPIFKKKYTTLELVITPPDSKENKDSSSFVMSIVPSALMSMTTLLTAYYSVKNYRSGTNVDKESLITSLVMCAVMLITSLIWPFVERIAGNIRRFINNRKRVIIYNKYLKRKKKELEAARNEQKMTLEFNNTSLKECQEVIQKRNSYLFSRNVNHDDFLTVKLGSGKVKLDCHTDYKKPDFLSEKDKLLDSIDKLLLEYEYIDDAPYTISFKKNRCVAFISEMINYEKYMNAIILQLVTLQDYSELKLVVLTSETSGGLNRIKELNHCWDDERSIRFFANNMHDAENLSSYLLKICNSRMKAENSNSTKNKYSTYYLIISDNINYYKNLKIVNSILDSENDIGFGLVIFGKKITDIPEGCQTFINYNEKEATTFRAEMNEKTINKFVPNFIDHDVDFNLCMRLISNIPIMLNNESRGILPEKLGFLELYGVGNVEQLNSINRWKTAPIINTLAAPIGVDSSGNTLSLDLHEKKHGPHGLIAGMTGSGKSEFIVTYILSLAVNYSPDEVQFVLIDYKGGGLAGAFENRKTGIKLPHLVGTITNLDKSSMNRTLVSIQSELQRRQRVFNEAKELLNTGTIDIYKYQKLVREGALKEPLSHLFIICDEFAELKAQQPDFMDQLVSAARIGRSLGVHLILATQKPSGVVDDQIWSNSKFKVCCKVQTAEDSKEMIRRDDAAFIKESGRFYLQVGYDEIFVKGQSAYTGTQYIPSETVTINVNDSIEFLDSIGNVTRTVVKEEKEKQTNEDLGEELGNILRYLIDCSKKVGFKNQQLWLDNVPTNLYLEDLRKKYPSDITKYVINPLIGEYDDPQNQKQGPVFVNLTKNGNVMISGNYGGGKTTLLATMIYSSIITHNTEELNIYIVDFLAETLKMFSNAPQVGDFISVVDRDKLTKLFHFLNKETTKRKKYFSNKGGSYFGAVNRGNVPFPNIVIVINGMNVFMETYDEIFEELFTPLTRDCNRVGITFVITSASSLPVAVESNFPQKIALRYLDVSEYTMIFNDTRGIIPGSNPGRGLIELDVVYEFQTAIIFNELSMERNLSYVINQLCQFLKTAPGIPTMPRIVTYDNVKNDITTLDMVPVGIELSSNCIYNYDFTNLITPIIYSNIKNITSFEMSLLKVLKQVEKTKVFVLDTLGTLDNIDGINMYTSNFKKLCKALYQNIIKKKSKDPSAEKIVFVISGYQKLQQHLDLMKKEDEEIITIDDLILESKDTANFKFIIINDYKLKSVDDKEWSDYLDAGNGIIIAMENDSQELIDYEDSYDDIKVNKDIAIIIKDSKKDYIKYVRNRS